MWVFSQNSIDDFIVGLQITINVFLLDEIESNCLVPVKIADFAKNSFILFVGEYFQAEENESNCETRKLFLNICKNFVNSVHEVFLFVFLDHFTVSVVLIKLAKHGSELHSIVSVLCVFDQNMLQILSEDVESKINLEEVADFNLKSIPDFLLVSCVLLHFFLVEHGNV